MKKTVNIILNVLPFIIWIVWFICALFSLFESSLFLIQLFLLFVLPIGYSLFNFIITNKKIDFVVHNLIFAISHIIGYCTLGILYYNFISNDSGTVLVSKTFTFFSIIYITIITLIFYLCKREKNKYNIVLFDLDGTLTDPGEGITNSVAYALKKFNITVDDKTKLYSFIGPPLVDSFMKYYGFSKDDALLAVDYYREYFGVTGIFENRVFDGIPQLLSDIKKSGRKIALATSKPEQYAMRILEHFNLSQYFDFVGGATMDETRSKKADVIDYTLKQLGITDKSKVVMVGDRHHDIEGANQNGLDSIGVLFGYGDREELETAGATYISETVNDIMKFL